jgi:hypothetical protein
LEKTGKATKPKREAISGFRIWTEEGVKKVKKLIEK